jgi:5-oxoprolinase (ATP-hydrolysing) subunit C
MSFLVRNPGLLTLPVDAGRPGSRAFGVPVSGPADARSYAIAQALVWNAESAVALEINVAGPTLVAENRVGAVIVGAPFTIDIAGRKSVAIGECFTLDRGDTLKIGGSPTGSRAYLCVPGGFSMPAYKAIAAGDRLDCPTSELAHWSIAYPSLSQSEPIRIVKGPQYEWFLNPGRIEQSTYTVAPARDRMGLRLQGDSLERKPGELTSEPVTPGSIQITNDGQPVILGVDGQTIGGYPKIGHVIRADMDRIGQLRPGDPIRMQFVSHDEADALNRNARHDIDEWRIRIHTRISC